MSVNVFQFIFNTKNVGKFSKKVEKYELGVTDCYTIFVSDNFPHKMQ